MRAFQEQDFEKMAERVVDRFMSGEKLADVAAMEAQQGQLNPDQIERMVQSANTMAFLRLMEQQKNQGGHDMTNEFDPIDTRQIMQQMVQQAPMPHMEQPPEMPMERPGMHADMAPLPDEMGAACPPGMPANDVPEVAEVDEDNDGPFPKGSKDSKKSKKKDGPKPAKKDEEKEAMFRANRMRKLADILEDQYRQAELAFEDEFTVLRTQLKVASGAPTPDAFEKDALALHGHAMGVVVLNLVKESQGLPPIDTDTANVKTAALNDHHIVDDTAANRTFESLVKIATDAARLQKAVQHMRAQCS